MRVSSYIDIENAFYVFFRPPKETWVFSKVQGLQHYFRQIFRRNLTYYESENFSDPSLHHIF